MSTVIDRTAYIPRDERGKWRDTTHRPVRYAEDAPGTWEEWKTIDDESPVANVVQAETLPSIRIYQWRSTGTYTTYWTPEPGVRASINSSTWFDAVSAAYAYTKEN